MPLLTVEHPSRHLYPWSFQSSFGVVIENLGVMGVPRKLMTIRGPQERTLRSRIDKRTLVDTLVEADVMEIPFGIPINVSGSRELHLRTADTRLAQWIGLFVQAHGRVQVRGLGIGDEIIVNGIPRPDPIVLPYFAGQKITYESTVNTHAGVTVALSDTTRPRRGMVQS